MLCNIGAHGATRDPQTVGIGVARDGGFSTCPTANGDEPAVPLADGLLLLSLPLLSRPQER
jgi:hypothetical protein